MPSIKQKRAAKILYDVVQSGVETNGGEICERAGYSKSVARHPKSVLESEGTKKELHELGFSVEGADSVVQNILYKGKREESKLKAADMVYKRLSAYAPEKSQTLNFNINGTTKDFEKHKEIKERYEQELKEALQKD